MSYAIFIKMDGIEGESTDARHKDEIDVLSWSWGVTQSSSPAAGGAGGAGRAVPADLKFSHRIDFASPSLIKACASGRHIKEAVVSVQKAGADPRPGRDPFLTIRLFVVTVKSVEPGVSTLENSATETVGLAFSKMEFEYRQEMKPGATSKVLWDVTANKVS
jgi:type VI secretion system secreted protein Hcp